MWSCFLAGAESELDHRPDGDRRRRLFADVASAVDTSLDLRILHVNTFGAIGAHRSTTMTDKSGSSQTALSSSILSYWQAFSQHRFSPTFESGESARGGIFRYGCGWRLCWSVWQQFQSR